MWIYGSCCVFVVFCKVTNLLHTEMQNFLALASITVGGTQGTQTWRFGSQKLGGHKSAIHLPTDIGLIIHLLTFLVVLNISCLLLGLF